MGTALILSVRTKEDFSLYRRVLAQKPIRFYSLHEPQIYCAAKGNEHKKYEFGPKASVAMTAASWRRNWQQIILFYSYPPKVRKIIYATNAIESSHMQLRKALKNPWHFPSEEAAINCETSLNRGNPPLTWRMAANQFAIQFGERFNK